MFKAGLLFVSFLLGSAFAIVSAQSPSYQKTGSGVIVHTDERVSGTPQTVELEVVANTIIRVKAAPGASIPARESLVTNYSKNPNVNWQLLTTDTTVTLQTNAIKAVVALASGLVKFYDSAGATILTEEQPAGRTFTPAVFDGQPSYHMVQSFRTSPSDAIYGLGQHQDDVFNYKGEQVQFFQNNTEVAIPYLVSNNHYGILWDNYSLTTVGDIRPFRPLTALQLFDKNGDEGWLTASYSNDKAKPGNVTLQRAESAIDMQYLGESLTDLPAGFTPSTGMVTWEGSLGTAFSGEHKFRFVFGGYLKVYVANKLVLDRWRKAWNPAPALLSIPLPKNGKTPIRIEWIPEGGESYLSVKWQEPAPEKDKDLFAFSSEAGQLADYYFVYGKNIADLISGYRYLTGKAHIVPKWAMGFWQSRERYKTSEELLAALDGYRQRNIPLDNIVLDWSYWKEDDWGSQDFDAARFPDAAAMVKEVHDKHAHIMISVWPKFYEGIEAYNEFDKNGWLYKRNIADRQRDWIGKGYVSTFYDAFNPAARKGFWNLINKHIWSKGFDAWWMDASEPDVLSNVSPERRKEQMTPTALGPAAEFLNAYPLQNAKGIYEGQRSVEPDKRVFLLTRSGFAGSQRYAAAIWSGDIGATWHDMKAQIPAGINFSMSGLPYWTMDIGGFVVESRFEKPDEKATEEWRELMARWYQFGAFAPIFRSHGQYPYREMYNIAPEGSPAYNSMVFYDKLRYRLMPYIYSLAGAAYHQNGTLVRGLAMDFAQDTAVNNIGDQYLFGPALLINPVYNYQQRKKDLYLPGGQGWYDLYSGKYFAGGEQITADAPMERMPVFVKEGSIVPVGPALQYVDEKPADTITLFVYTGKDALFTLYEDGGTTYDYEKGAFTSIPLIYNESTQTLTIEDRQGSYPSMLQRRVFRVVAVSPKAPKALSGDARSSKSISYSGKAVQVKL